MLKPLLGAAALSLVASLSHASGLFAEAGNWAAVFKGNRCHVYTLSSARDTSGYLEFAFDKKGYNASFDYIYIPWTPDESEPPWNDITDSVSLYIGDEQSWLGDEMFFYTGPGFTYGASLTGGFVGELLSEMMSANSDFGFAVDRAAEGETWLYGKFSLNGLEQAMTQAGAMCEFNPRALPES
ncbi:hypothetical protein [Phaeobacter sp. HF9A]|uniref:hypothetical protein n=1 Tax=Phaeobacter sp. HF9A TaxID=2721561 RepID=UPI0014307CEB|nr:hypothetical protein [Phaeobacter sp. HF9A]NIZ13753.1 hypothetical protein [Phaeobacter sp. HF9A]